jgi:hypothetical protein
MEEIREISPAIYSHTEGLWAGPVAARDNLRKYLRYA